MAPETKHEDDQRFLREWGEDIRRAAEARVETAEWFNIDVADERGDS